MKRLLSALLCLLLLSATGCWSRVEVSDLAIVALVGIDRTPEGEIELWINVVVPARAGGAPGAGMPAGQPGNPFITLNARGKTILHAATRLQRELPRRLFWAHARVILLGERLARSGSQPAVDFLTRHRELRLTNYVLVVRGNVEEIMSAPVDLERLPSEYVREIERSRIVPVSTMRDLVESMASTGADPLLAVTDRSEPPDGAPPGQRPGVRVSGAALFRKDKLVDYVGEEITQGILWLRGEARVGLVTVTVPGVPGNISVEWLYASVNRTARLENGRPVIYVQVRTEGDVAEEQAPLDVGDTEQLRLVERQLRQEIKDRMQRALKTMQSLNVDTAGLGEEIHRHLPAVWQRMEKRWHDDGFRNVKVIVSVEAHIRRTGLSSQPQGIPENELMKGRE
ncbi:MAG TPA: Ger(x)C family spore germination protein [Symbiobacteriaceae bacterium]|nr:Ger(x)C family spore germination protein [Symbiobacteriaceae bacterium]